MPKRTRSPDSVASSNKKKKYYCKFQSAWCKDYPCIRRSDNGDGSAFCTACNCSFSISHGGLHDVIRHTKTAVHIKSEKAVKSTPKVTSMFMMPDSQSDKVLKAETLFSYFVAEHNLPFMVADHFSKLCKHSRGISWKNCIGYSSDNASVMVGKKNSVLSRIKEQQPKVFDLGCVCHLANIALTHAMKDLPVNLEEFLTDVFFHFNHSAKRKEQYKEFLEFTDTDPMKIIKHCSTRWLSLQKVVTRFLQQWPALVSYFTSHEDREKTGRVQRAADSLNSLEMKMYFFFLEFILPHLNEFNTMFQTDNCIIMNLVPEMKNTLKTFLAKFVKVSIIKSTEITKVPYDDINNQHTDELLAMGMKARTFLADHCDDFEPSTLDRIYRSVRNFYMTIVKNMVKKFPFDDIVLNSINFVNPAIRESVSFECVAKVNKRFDVTENEDELREEFTSFQLAEDEDLPSYSITNLDNFWAKLSQDVSGLGKKRYGVLAKLCLTVLSLPNSNAAVERSFSILRKIEQDARGNLNNYTTCSLMSIKLNMDIECFALVPEKCLIKEVSKCCKNYKDRVIDDK